MSEYKSYTGLGRVPSHILVEKAIACRRFSFEMYKTLNYPVAGNSMYYVKNNIKIHSTIFHINILENAVEIYFEPKDKELAKSLYRTKK